MPSRWLPPHIQSSWSWVLRPLSHSAATRPINDIPGFFRVEWYDEKRNRNWHMLLCSVQGTRLVTLADRNFSHSHTISGIIKVVHVFFVLLTAATSINPYLVWRKEM